MASAPTENTNPVPASNNEAPAAEEEEEVNPEPQEAKMPTRRDISLKEFLNKMDDYAPIVRLPCYPPSFPHLALHHSVQPSFLVSCKALAAVLAYARTSAVLPGMLTTLLTFAPVAAPDRSPTP